MSQTNHNPVPNFFRAAAADFKKIPGSPIAYWVSYKTISLFAEESVRSKGEIRQGLLTSDNERFLRRWHEVEQTKIGFGLSRIEALNSGLKWFPINKGGDYRRWYGNLEYVVIWENDGKELHDTVIKKYPYLNDKSGLVLKQTNPYFSPAITWTDISSTYFGARYMPHGMLYEKGGSCAYNPDLKLLLGYFCSKLSSHFLKLISPTLHYQVGDVGNLPFKDFIDRNDILKVHKLCDHILSFSKKDWDAYETSWDFTVLPLLHPDYRQDTLAATYAALRHHWQNMTDEMQRLEQENNRLFIDAYGLQDELSPEVPLNEITLTCNPHYRYGNDKPADELETLLRADTIRELLSYGVGCLFGRYSMDAPGLILANQGETLADYLAKIPEPTITPDEDNIIPVLQDDYFADDLTARLKQFLRLTFGETHYPANLRFVEDALGKDLRSYLVKDFYNDHVRRYKKRPIYWLFQSPGKGFAALIYLHRYRSDTVSRLLNGYVREYQVKLKARLHQVQDILNSVTADKAAQKRADKERVRLEKLLRDLSDYEQRLHPIAAQKIELDLDDGVKVNYGKFDGVVAKISGLGE